MVESPEFTETSWAVIDGIECHIIPLHDSFMHNLSSACPCDPSEWDYGTLHNSFDKREMRRQ